ncbi:MAG: DUF1641 domain-containing protein [Acidimicrobiia bacterium]|nr:DUF1641 domain-containing protein [Acidimicrobiia bacterium]
MTLTATEADRLAAIEEQLATITGSLDKLTELTSELSALGGDAFMAATERLAEADRRGYFEFAKAAAGVADRIVTGYETEDVEALGENVVLILDAVKEMTQPEVMAMLRRTALTVRDEGAEPVSLFGLVRATKDPQVKRGLGRLVALLRSLGGPAQGGK